MTYRHFLIASSVLLLLASGRLEAVVAVSSPSRHFAYRAEPYEIESLSVAYGESLVIDPGVTLELPATGSVSIDGELIAQGTAAAPIVFTGQGGGYWQGFATTERARAELGEVVFSRSLNPIQLLDHALTVGPLTVSDGIINVLQIGKPGIQYDNLEVGHLSFLNKTAGSAMRQSGLLFQGIRGTATVGGVTFQDGRLLSAQASTTSFVRLEGKYGQVVYGNLRFPHGCSSTLNPYQLQKGFIELDMDVRHCPDKPVPLIFVPGYGTSINLSRLGSTDLDTPQLDGWRFFKELDPAYFAFLDTVRSQGIPYEIAYYDWRLPADQAARQYLQPIIERAKRTYATDRVDIAAHSFGGIVSRAYIQGDNYGGDVESLVEIGTPNAGAAKAYGIWEAGELPDDWQSLAYLLRYYNHKLGGFSSQKGIIWKLFPSAHQIMPTYAALTQGGLERAPQETLFDNEYLSGLNRGLATLSSRVSSAIVASRSEPTAVLIPVGPPQPGAASWPDGKPGGSPLAERGGDGTVPWVSALAANLPVIETTGQHANLPAAAAAQIINRLYGRTEVGVQPLPASDPTLSFLFDCPVAVTIRLPDGRSRSSQVGDGQEDPQVGEVAQSDDLLWMVIPRQPGHYVVTVKALGDTQVRDWVEEGPDASFYLKEGESKEQYLTVTDSGNLEWEMPSVSVSPPSSPAQFPTNGPAASFASSSAPVTSLAGRSVAGSALATAQPSSAKAVAYAVPSGQIQVKRFRSSVASVAASVRRPALVTGNLVGTFFLLLAFVKRPKICDDE